MKKLILLLTILSANAYAQKINVAELKGNYLKSILCSVDTVVFKSNNDISVILYKISNTSGSAHMSESDEVSNKFLIAVSSIDDSPEDHLFSIGNFYNPQKIKFEQLKNDNYRISFEYGIFKSRKKIALIVSLKNVLIENR